MVKCVSLDIYGLEGPTAVKKYSSSDINGSIISLDTYGLEEKVVIYINFMGPSAAEKYSSTDRNG